MRRNGLTSSILYSLREAHSKNPSFAISCAPDTFQSRSFFMVGARSSRKDCMAHRYASTVPRRNVCLLRAEPGGFALRALFLGARRRKSLADESSKGLHTHTETHCAAILKLGAVSSVELIYLGRIHDRTLLYFSKEFLLLQVLTFFSVAGFPPSCVAPWPHAARSHKKPNADGRREEGNPAHALGLLQAEGDVGKAERDIGKRRTAGQQRPAAAGRCGTRWEADRWAADR